MLRIFTTSLLAVMMLVSAVSTGSAQTEVEGTADAETQDVTSGGQSPADIFDRRILPIFRSVEPSSCVQCHLSSVDLKNYILPSQEKTFVSLRDQGLIDLDAPEKSKILTLIQMGERDLDKGAQLIHEANRNAEYEAFAAWVSACVDDPALRSLPRLSPSELARPEKPDAVIRHARKSRVVDSFVRNVWSQRMRCFPCHTPHEIDPENPKHQAPIKTRNEFKLKYNEEQLGRIDIFQETPEATLKYLIERSRQTPEGELPLLNLENPRQSLLVLKPMSKLPRKIGEKQFEAPSYVEPVTHMGGLKMHPDDQSYKSFVSWIADYAKVVGDRYASVEELPADNWYASQLVLRLRGTPEDWPVGTPVQLFVYDWNEEQKVWGDEPIAFTQGTIAPRKMVNGALFLLADESTDPANKPDREHASLPRGRYLVKAYVDLNRRLADDPTLMLAEKEFHGQVELKRARWREGFRNAEVIDGKNLVNQ